MDTKNIKLIKIIKYLSPAIIFYFLTACATKPILTDEINTTPNLIAAQYNIELGLAYLQQGDRSRAKHKLLLALQQAPDSPQVLDAMAYYLEITGATQAAENDYLQAIKLAPTQGATLNNYGVFLCKQGRYAASVQEFMAASKDPDYLATAKIYENAGICALAMHDKQKAIYYFERAIQEDPRSTNASAELKLINNTNLLR